VVGDLEGQDQQDADNLLQVLKNSVVPEFFDRDGHGIPREWIARIRHSMKTLIPVYNTDRMVAEYVKKYYVL
jgi:starch phosphorylase